MFYKKVVLRNFTKFTGKHLWQSLFFNKVANFIKKETLAQVFSCEFCEVSKKNFLTEHVWATASKKNIDKKSNMIDMSVSHAIKVHSNKFNDASKESEDGY